MKHRSPFTRSMFNRAPRNNETETELFIYDEIGFWGIQAEAFVRELSAIDSERIVLRINSPGGSVFDGVAMMQAIEEHPAHIEARIDGLAASMASGIAMAADEIVMTKGSFMMIHNAMSFAVGYADDLRKEADLLDNISETLAANYEERTGRDDILELMAAETWMNPQEAVEMNFADRVFGDSEPTDHFDLSVFNNVPDSVVTGSPSDRAIEKALRDVGLSRKEARAYVSAAKSGTQSDADPAPIDDSGAVMSDWLSDIIQQRRSLKA